MSDIEDSESVFRRFRYSWVALSVACGVLLLGVFGNINVFDIPGVSVIGLEHTEVGEVAIAFLLVIPAFFVDRVARRQRAHETDLRAEQLRVVRVTMRTVEDIVNNNLNELQLLRLYADGNVPEEALATFDSAIQNTAAQISALGNLTVFAERPMGTGSGLAVPEVLAVQAARR